MLLCISFMRRSWVGSGPKGSLRAEYDGRYDLQALLHYEQANELNLKVEL